MQSMHNLQAFLSKIKYTLVVEKYCVKTRKNEHRLNSLLTGPKRIIKNPLTRD